MKENHNNRTIHKPQGMTDHEEKKTDGQTKKPDTTDHPTQNPSTSHTK